MDLVAKKFPGVGPKLEEEDFTLDPDWWPSLDVVDGDLYVNMEWGAKKFQLKDGLAWLAGSTMEWTSPSTRTGGLAWTWWT